MFTPLLQDFRPTAFAVDLTIDATLFRSAALVGARVAAVLRKPRPRALWSLALNPAARHVDRFLLPHPEGEFAVRELPPPLRSRGRQLGPVVKLPQPERVQAMRERHRHTGRPLVVAAVGGGGYEESRQTVNAVEQAASATPEANWVIVYGPYLSLDIAGDPPPHVTRLRFEPELLELCAAADLVICNAGYNTIREMEVVPTRAIVVPVHGTGRDDQFERARGFTANGGGWVGEAKAETLTALVQRALGQSGARRQPSAQVPPAVLGQRFWDCLES